MLVVSSQWHEKVRHHAALESQLFKLSRLEFGVEWIVISKLAF